MKSLAHLNKYLLRYKWHLVGGILFLIASNYLKTLQPVVVRYAFDYTNQLLERISTQSEVLSISLFGVDGMVLFKYALLIVGLTTLGGVLLFLTRRTLIVMSRLIEKDLRDELFTHYNLLDQKFYKTHNTGDLMSRITEDVAKVRMYLGPGIMYTVNLISVFILVIYSMLSVSPKLTLYVLLPLPILSISIYYVSSIINRKSTVIQAQLSYLTTLAQEVFSGIRVIKSFTQERSMERLFQVESQKYKDKNLELARVRALFFPLMMLLVGASTIICIYQGGKLVLAGEITNGNIAEFVIYVNMLSWPMTAVGWIASMVQEAAASQTRINAFLETEPDYALTQDGLTKDIKGKIDFENVSFTYPETGIEALKDINLSFGAGERILLIGRTGSGKSTIFDLLLGIYPVSAGLIKIDNTPLESFNLAHLRKQIAYVPQDVFLFSTDIRNNIAFGLEYMPEQSVIEKYSAYSAINDEIKSLPNSYDTLVGERGVSLSGGQKQRISIARALITQPSIILLDDALSAIDANAESKILEFLDTELQGKTAVISSHRVYPHLNFDRIIVLEDGKISAQGTHKELIQQAGYYAEIYQKQIEKETEIE